MSGHERRLPMPRPDGRRWREVREAGFAAYPARAENFARFRASRRGETVDHLPIRLDIENVSRCNYRCTMCQVSDWPHMKRAADMSVEAFRDLLDAQLGLVELKIQGMGEPLMADDALFEMIAIARERHLWVRTTTNGSLLHLRDNHRRLVDAGTCEAIVSVDGASADTYEAIRRGGRFEQVCRNARLLAEYARGNRDVRVRMWVVVQAANLHELERFPALAAELGFEHLTLSLDLNDWGQDRWRAINDPADAHRDLGLDRPRALVDAGRALGVDVTFWYLDEKYDAADPAKLCPWPFERAYVSSDMRVVPCCMISNPEVLDLGDAARLDEIWNGDAYRGFRAAHLEGRVPDVCRTCYRSAAPAPRRVAPEADDFVDTPA